MKKREIISTSPISDFQEEKFQLTKKQSEDIFENIQTGIYVYELENINDDSSLRLIAANPASYKLTGMNLDELIGKRIDEIFPGLRKDGVTQKFADVIRSHKQIEIDDLYFENEKIKGIFSVKAFSLPNNRLGVAFENITERKNAEETLKESELRYRLLFNTSTDAIFMIRENIIIDCNEASVTMFGCTVKNDLINKTPFYFSPDKQPDNNDSVQKGMEKIKKALSGVNQVFEWQHIKNDGTPFDTEVSLHKFYYGGEICLQAVIRDLTSRKIVQKSLMESELKFRNVFNSSSDGIIIVRQDRSIIESNDNFNLNTGYKWEEVVQMKTNDFTHPKDHEMINEKIKLLLGLSKIPSFELNVKTKNGTYFPAEIHAILIDYEGEKAFLVIVRDIKERKLLEKKIFDAVILTEEKEREKFAKNLHDDLGPLLSSIKMYVNSINTIKDFEKQKFIIDQLNDIVREAIQSTKEISNDLSPHVLKNYGLIAAIESFSRKIEEHISIKLQNNIDNTRLGEEMETSLYRIIKELINNTIKHANATEISLKIFLENNILSLMFSDNGKGFDTSIINNKSTPGMGLSNIISRIGFLKGRYSFKSEDKNGFEFNIEIPL